MATSACKAIVHPVRERLRGGATLTVVDGVAEAHDEGGRLLLRYDGETLELAAQGDLRLAASGRVTVASGEGIELKSDEVSLTAGRLTTTASVLVQRVERLETVAVRITEHAREAYREISELAQTRAARMRTLVEQSFSIMSGSTDMVSEEETRIDGDKILLG